MAITKRSPIQITQDVLFALVLREFLTRFGNRRMGAFWMLFEPAIHIGVMMFIFAFIRAREVPGMDLPIFLLTGIIPFFLMRNIALQLMNAVGANQALFAYPNIKIFDTYMARVFVELLIMSTIYAIFIFILGFWLGYDVSIAEPLQWMYSILTGILFSFGLGVALSSVVQVFPNLKSLISLMFMPLYFISGVIFPLWIIPEKYLHWILWNPYAHIISNIREAVFVAYPEIPGVNHHYPFMCTVIFLFAGIGLYRVRRDQLLMR